MTPGRSEVRTIQWVGGRVTLIDQTLLPLRERYVTCGTWEEVASAIRNMVVRGAPAIGVAAAMAMAMAAREAACGPAGFERALHDATNVLFSTRPTAVNLGWALEQMGRVWRRSDLSVQERVDMMERRALQIQEEDVSSCRCIGEYGADLILSGCLAAGAEGGGQRGAPAPDPVILTHCNAGALATAGYGTALGIIRSVHARRPGVRVLTDETRPLLQGARLTAWELQRDGIACEVITDGMAGHFLKSGEITHVIVGADRIAANGDTANKIGTYGVAVLARENSVPFIVAAPLSTADFDLPDGSSIPIEERAAEEVTWCGGRQMCPAGVAARNPSFDVTPARYITAIVTDRGAALPPLGPALRAVAGHAGGTA